MKLEIKHLAPYLPYGLKYHLPIESERFDSILEHEPFRLAIPFISKKDEEKYLHPYKLMFFKQEYPSIMWEDSRLFLGQMKSSLGFEEDDVYLDEVKPILRPLSDLTKEIEHNGERFVPIDYLEDMIDFSYGYERIEYWKIQKLFEWHFDVFELIPAGLAIDINTLNK